MVRVRNEAYALLILASIALISHVHIQGISSLAKNDPYPMFTTLDPQEFLYTQDKLLLKGMIDQEHYWKVHVSFSVPLKYKKQGVRFDFEANICDDICVSVQIGVADITQCVPQTFVMTTTFNDITVRNGTFFDTRRLGFIDLTCAAGDPCDDMPI